MNYSIYERLGIWMQIGVHWRHYIKSQSDLRVFSNRHPFQILWNIVDLLVMVSAYVNYVIGRRFEKVRNGRRIENWMPIWEFEKKDIDLRYRFLWRRNRTWIWGLDVYLSLIYMCRTLKCTSSLLINTCCHVKESYDDILFVYYNCLVIFSTSAYVHVIVFVRVHIFFYIQLNN
jgi:hypothetical protein